MTPDQTERQSSHLPEVSESSQSIIGGGHFVFMQTLPSIISRQRILRCSQLAQTDLCIDLETLGWTSHVHPEGDTYYHHKGLRATVSIVSKTTHTAQSIHRTVAVLGQTLPIGPDDNVEIVLFIGYPDDTTKFYYVDHASRIVSSESTAFMSSPDEGALGAFEYWNHIEMFPCHQALSINNENELISLLRHGVIDDRTAPGSISAYSTKECVKYLSLLEQLKDLDEPGVLGRRTATFSRLWHALARVRYINSYGLPSARLDRLQGFSEHTDPISIWNGRVVYQRHWHTFFNELRLKALSLAAGPPHDRNERTNVEACSSIPHLLRSGTLLTISLLILDVSAIRSHRSSLPKYAKFCDEIENELKAILGKDCIDDLISSRFVCRWNGPECSECMPLLESFKGYEKNGLPDHFCAVARLLTALARARHINQYGSKISDVNRLQTLLENHLSFKRLGADLGMSGPVRSCSTYTALQALHKGKFSLIQRWAALFRRACGHWMETGQMQSSVLWLINASLTRMIYQSRWSLLTVSLAAALLAVWIPLRRSYSSGMISVRSEVVEFFKRSLYFFLINEATFMSNYFVTVLILLIAFGIVFLAGARVPSRG